jgi:hypothetical protein
MSITKEKTVTVQYFDESWAPRGTFLRIIDIESIYFTSPLYGWVKDYIDNNRIMNVYTIDGRSVDITPDELNNYIINRYVPESDDTLDMDYKSLINEVDWGRVVYD